MAATLVQRAYRFALAPTPAQQRAFASHAGGARYAYNWGLTQIAAALDAYAAEKDAGVGKPTTKIPKHFDLCRDWTAYKDAHVETPDERGRTTGWVGENSVGIYQAALRDAAGAWQKFFDSRGGRRRGKAVGRPRYKAKHRSPAKFQVHGGTLALVDGSHIKLPKIGVVKIPGKVRVGEWVDRNARTARKLSRLLRRASADGLVVCPTCGGGGKLTVRAAQGDKTYTVKCGKYGDYVHADDKRPGCRGGGKVERARIVRATLSRGASGTWWCSVTAELVQDVPTGPNRRQRAGGTVGIDLGVRHLAVTSAGLTYTNSRVLAAAMGDLRVAQKALSRTQKDSRRRDKARLRVGTLHERVALMRKDATDRITTEVARHHERVVVEGWDAQRLAERGSDDVPVRLRKARNQALADAAPGMIRWQLEYKTSWLGATLVKTDPGEPSGRRCSACGTVRAKPVPLAEEQFRCDHCGHKLDRRQNTAKVLAKLGRGDFGAVAAPEQPRGGDVRPATPRRGRRSPVKRDTRTRRTRRGKTGTPDP